MFATSRCTSTAELANQQPEENRPILSVVIASVNGPHYVQELLKSLEAQEPQSAAEVVIADCCGESLAQVVQRGTARIKLLSFAERKSIPELRALALRAAAGEIIAVTEDHCVPDQHWCDRILAAHRRHYGVIGGAVENHPECQGLVDWAAYFCEYSQLMNPVETGESQIIAGNNLSYRREFLEQISDMLDAGCFWEESLLARLREKGIPYFSDPSIIVYHKKSFAFGYFLRQRYHYARAYGGFRVEGAGPAKKLLYAAFCAFLPALLLARITARVSRKRRYLGKFTLAQPALWVFLFSWAAGELIGSLFGPGESLQKIE